MRSGFERIAPLAAGLAFALGLGFDLRAAGSRGGPSAAASDLLSGIEFIPDRAALDGALGDDALAELIAIAEGSGSAQDTGVRIRAYRALAHYPSPLAQFALAAAVREHGAEQSGVSTIFARAAMDSLAQIAGESAIPTIAPMLEHVSRDVRAGAARSLGLTASESAIAPLEERLRVERIEQVQVAIEDALRELTENTEGTVESGEMTTAPQGAGRGDL